MVRFANGLVVFLVCSFNVTVCISQETSFSYQGQLNQSGAPANGIFDMTFSLFDAQTGGSEVVGSVNHPTVSIRDGVFSVELDFGAEAFGDANRWIQIEIEGTELSPRYLVSAAPRSLQTRGLFVNDSESFAGFGRETRITAFENFGVHSSVLNDFGGMYVSTEGLQGKPFYGYATGGVADVFHYYDGRIDTWYLYNFGEKIAVSPDGVGIGYDGGFYLGMLEVDAQDRLSAINAQSDDDFFPTANLVNDGTGPTLWATGNTDTSLAGGGIVVIGPGGGRNISIDQNEIMARDNRSASILHLNLEGGNVAVGAASAGTSVFSTPILEITGGSDLSEMFDIHSADAKPGMVVVIDEENPGQLKPCDCPDDTKVAGIISGAGGVSTGLRMKHSGTVADGKFPVALTGRVYCYADATQHEIKAGDLLTTSSRIGFAMKANQPLPGSLIGKAMSSLKKGESGLVLVLVNLQ